MARVQEKLVHPDATLVTVRHRGLIVGMALVEPYRASYGTGAPVPGAAHVSMVFDRPTHQRQGVGRALVDAIVEEHPGQVLSVWTRDSNEPARALYAATGFRPTEDGGRNPHGATLTRWERPATGV